MWVTPHSSRRLRTVLSDGTVLGRNGPGQLRACSCSLAFVLLEEEGIKLFEKEKLWVCVWVFCWGGREGKGAVKPVPSVLRWWKTVLAS